MLCTEVCEPVKQNPQSLYLHSQFDLPLQALIVAEYCSRKVALIHLVSTIKLEMFTERTHITGTRAELASQL